MSDMPEFGLLSGYRVVMMGLSVAAPFAGELYAEHGAEVIWIENPKAVDSARVARRSGSWQQDRRNMRSLSMNYVKGEGREAFLKLMESTDVLIEASVGGRFEKIGLSDEALWERNPGLVVVHISGFGQTGDPDYVSRGSYDPIAQAFGCAMRMNGLPDQPSAPAMPFPADYAAAFYAFGMANAALLRRVKTGVGESIDVAQFETMIRLQANYPHDYLRYGLDYVKEGNHSRICALYGTYTASDGEEIYLLMLGPGAVKKTLGVLGVEYGTDQFPEGMTFVPVDTPEADLVEAKFATYLATRTAAQVEEELAQLGVPCSRLMDYEQARNNPQYRARGVFTSWMGADDATEVQGVKVVPELKKNPGRVWRGAPTIGQDNERILGELGLTRSQIAAMYERGELSARHYFETTH